MGLNRHRFSLLIRSPWVVVKLVGVALLGIMRRESAVWDRTPRRGELQSTMSRPIVTSGSLPLTPTRLRPLHVAIVDEELPYPPNSGKRIRTLNLVMRLAKRHRITYLCHQNADADEAKQASLYFKDLGINTVVVDRRVPTKSGLAFYGRLGANLFSTLPYTVASHGSSLLRQAIQDHAASHPVDLWHCEWSPYFELLRGLTGRPRVVIAHNIESQIWKRYHQAESNPWKRWYIMRQWMRFQRFERRVFAEATLTVFVSAYDAALAQTEFGALRVAVVDNGVDTVFFRPDEGPRDTNRILFLGSLDWRPNLDAVQLLLDHIFRRVRAEVPAARLSIVGRYPPDWLVRRTSQEPGVEMAANVPDVRPYLNRCGVMAVPLRIGGGSRLKILEALACGMPVVTTTIGVEGLRLEDGRHIIIADEIEDFAQALIRCLRTPEPALATAHEGRSVVLKEYDWDSIAARLGKVWEACGCPEKDPV
jgi:glycosyltransferase involved in cell wall biosynthesis